VHDLVAKVKSVESSLEAGDQRVQKLRVAQSTFETQHKETADQLASTKKGLEALTKTLGEVQQSINSFASKDSLQKVLLALLELCVFPLRLILFFPPPLAHWQY